MKKDNLILLIINLVGGAFVLGSYVVSILLHEGSGMDFWGQTSESLIPIYTVFMFLAMISYLVFSPYLIFMVDSSNSRMWSRLSYRAFYLPFLIILIFSVFWMPLTLAYMRSPSSWLWVLIQMDLLFVGLGTLMLFLFFLGLKPRKAAIWYWACIPFFLLFIFQTVILDPFLWTAGFLG
ncbi:MAG: hypothetical protein JXR63_09580 [Spirochaetales bacterium]|nr:hypothetical protein [Spirochaetales bacterium]